MPAPRKISVGDHVLSKDRDEAVRHEHYYTEDNTKLGWVLRVGEHAEVVEVAEYHLTLRNSDGKDAVGLHKSHYVHSDGAPIAIGSQVSDVGEGVMQSTA